MESYIALAVPIFFALIAFELFLVRHRRREYYRLADSMSNIATGMLQQLVTLLGAVWIVGVYAWIHDRFGLFELPADAVWVWVAAFVLVDFAYYWYHRSAHEVNFLWASHIAHHQSEEYNLSVALRQGAFQPLFSCVFYWPLAWLGVPPAVFVACLAFDTLYQFWIHTRTIDRLGPLEAVLMTPSHHRVHHGRNPRYVDRNHGGCFIFWDKLFGTFEPEGEPVVYGITSPLGSWNPLWANLHYWVELFAVARRTRRWRDKLAMFWKPPGWHPADLGGFRPAPEIEQPPRKFDPPLARSAALYTGLQFAQVLVASSAVSALASGWSGVELGLATALIAWALLGVGAVCDGRAWAPAAEALRVAATPLLCLPLLEGAGLLVAAALVANVAPLYWLLLRGAAPGRASFDPGAGSAP